MADETPGAAAASALRVAHEPAPSPADAAQYHHSKALEWLRRAEVDYREPSGNWQNAADYTEALAAAKIAELHLMLADRAAAEAVHRG